MYAKILLGVVAALVISGCSTTPEIDTSDSSQATFDGLYPVRGARADAAWARPDIDLTHFTKIMLHGVGVQYRPGGESGRSLSARNSGGPFEVTEAQKAAFEAIMREAFLEELARSERFTIVSEPGPDVLLIRGALLDVVSNVPTDPVGARNRVFLSRVGEATLVLELRDSITETVLARSVDRRAAEDSLGMRESNRANNTAEVRRLARAWARKLREALDEFGAPAE